MINRQKWTKDEEKRLINCLMDHGKNYDELMKVVDRTRKKIYDKVRELKTRITKIINKTSEENFLLEIL